MEGGNRSYIVQLKKRSKNDQEMDIPSAAAPQAKRRLLKDIQRVQTELLDQGIWYDMNEADMTKGFAMLKGPSDTPYEGCLLIFSVQFPSDYPFSPPKVLFLTSDGRTRFHPNLYVDGKVCLSILGTYSGPSWSGTQSLSSVLLSILALLDANPLAHEPAYASGNLLDAKHRDYADYVEHQMVKLMIETLDEFETKSYSSWEPFREQILEQIPLIKASLRKKILEREKAPERLWGSLVYGMGGRSFWKKIARESPWIREA